VTVNKAATLLPYSNPLTNRNFIPGKPIKVLQCIHRKSVLTADGIKRLSGRNRVVLLGGAIGKAGRIGYP
jgi:hypothetical protein